MDIWKKYKSPLGYETGNNGIDSYGVNHSGFSLRDEIEYQTARADRENKLIQDYNNQGITENYPQVGTSFWGNPENNYGFGSSNITSAISAHPAMNTTPTPLQPVQTQMPQTHFGTTSGLQTQTPAPWSTSATPQHSGYSNSLNNLQGFGVNNYADYNTSSQPQSDVWLQQKRRAIENDLLMNGMDVLYGMNRTTNGMTFGGLDWLGNKLGYDTQMNEYLNMKDIQSRDMAKQTGKVVGYGGSALTGGAIAQAGYNQANMAYNGYKIGKAYDKLSVDPYQGNGRDIIARMRNHNGEPVVLQRGEAIPGENGQPVVYGENLRRATIDMILDAQMHKEYQGLFNKNHLIRTNMVKMFI